MINLLQGFKLHFHFGPNDYFTDTELIKEYFMKCEANEKGKTRLLLRNSI